MLQIGGFKAQRSWVTCLAWAVTPPSPPLQGQGSPPSSNTQLLLFSGSSDGCLRLHTQSVTHLGKALAGDAPGGLLQKDLMQRQETVHEADLLGVTCMDVKASHGNSALISHEHA